LFALVLPFFCSVFLRPFFFAFDFQKKSRVRIWIYEDTKTQLEGQIIGFDEYMNMVLDDAVEIGKKRTEIGRILLKGDSITMLLEANPQRKQPPPGEES
jgi:small nuclear ribonucleoprotein E